MYERKKEKPTKEQNRKRERNYKKLYIKNKNKNPKTDPLITKISKYKFEIVHLKNPTSWRQMEKYNPRASTCRDLLGPCRPQCGDKV